MFYGYRRFLSLSDTPPPSRYHLLGSDSGAGPAPTKLATLLQHSFLTTELGEIVFIQKNQWVWGQWVWNQIAWSPLEDICSREVRITSDLIFCLAMYAG